MTQTLMTESDKTIRLFPLTGMLLLPGTFLPLNIFEPRYRQLVARAMDDDRRIGMIQPRKPLDDNGGPLAEDPEEPELYGVGCVGEVVECDLQPDGRYWIVLKGESRFQVVSELAASPGGYRRVVADLAPYRQDLHEMESDFPVDQLLGRASELAVTLDLAFDIDLLASLSPAHAVNALCAALPFEPAEKQALLESPSPQTRSELLIGLIDMHPRSGGPSGEPPPYVPPTVN